MTQLTDEDRALAHDRRLETLMAAALKTWPSDVEPDATPATVSLTLADAKRIRQLVQIAADHRKALKWSDWAAARTQSQGEGWRPEVIAFAYLMEAKLRENDHKGGWKTEDADDLFEQLGAECVELSEAVGLWRIQDDWKSSALHLPACRKNVAREAADVANFAMMIADVCGALPAPPASQTKG